MLTPSPTAPLPATLRPSVFFPLEGRSLASSRRQGDEPLGDGFPGRSSRIISTCAGSRRKSKWTCAATQRWPRRTSSGSRVRPPATKSASRPGAASSPPCRKGRHRTRFPVETRRSVRCSSRPPLRVGHLRTSTSARISSTTSWKWTPKTVCGNLEPDFRLLATFPLPGLIVTSRSADPQFDFVSRFFPRLGVDEDPVCGSAHCCLVNFWRKRLGKSEFVAFQASARGGVVKVRVVKDRVFLSGKAITVAKGELLVERSEL